MELGTIIICFAMVSALGMIIAARAITRVLEQGNGLESRSSGLSEIKAVRHSAPAIVHGATALLLLLPVYLFMRSGHEIAANLIRWRTAPGFELQESATILVGAAIAIAAIAIASKSTHRLLSRHDRSSAA